jgi:hypothetical protein
MSNYKPLVSAKSLSEKIAHFLEWTYQDRSGVKISVREVAQEVFQIRRPTEKNIKDILHRSNHARRILRESYKLGLEHDEDGFRALDKVDDLIRKDYIPIVGYMGAKQRRLNASSKLIEIRGGVSAVSDTPEGAQLAEFYTETQAKVTNKKFQLPPRSEIRGLLTSHNLNKK